MVITPAMYVVVAARTSPNSSANAGSIIARITSPSIKASKSIVRRSMSSGGIGSWPSRSSRTLTAPATPVRTWA
jgi:hypothetical protein